MKKFDLKGVKGVFANLRGGEKSASKGEVEIPETLQPHDFYCGKVDFSFSPSFNLLDNDCGNQVGFATSKASGWSVQVIARAKIC